MQLHSFSRLNFNHLSMPLRERRGSIEFISEEFFLFLFFFRGNLRRMRRYGKDCESIQGCGLRII